MKRCYRLLLVTCLLMGCGGTTPVKPTEEGPRVTSEDEFKERIAFIAESGGTGSALAGIVEMAQQNGDAGVVADAKALEKAQSPEQAKTIAKKLLEKLK